MKISMNNVGNYSPTALRQKAEPTQKKWEAQLNAELKADKIVNEKTPITEDEKNFFAGLYPENQKEIIDYHFYEKSGKMAGVRLGSQIDRRG